MKTLIIYGHPDKNSLGAALADAYKNKIAEQSNVKTLHLTDLQFELDLGGNYKSRTEQMLEPDIIKAQELIRWADHLVFAYPIWWGLMPALLKGFLDRVFLPDYAFKYVEGKALPEKLLKGKTARLLVTADSPNFWYSLVMGRPSHIAMRRSILGFCGISPIKIKTFGNVRSSSPELRKRWLQQAAALAHRDTRSLKQPDQKLLVKQS